MLFNSIDFLIFLPIVILIYFLTPHSIRWLILLISSYYFYMSWNPNYIILIIIVTLINYFAAIGIFKTKRILNKRIYLWIGIISSLSILFFFKYFNFVSNSVSDFLRLFSIQWDPFLLNILLPVGISFYIFQVIGYIIDVYTGKVKPEKHFGIFALYVSFFPQLVAGPIERAKHLLPQFRKKHDFNYDFFISGLKIMLWGFFLKIVIADRLSIVVNQVYNNVGLYSGIPLILATYFFAFQIYCDFAGYSFIAIGVAKIMGFDLMENFRRPYFSQSISEFWRRWHISLSSWFKDYIYIPLGGNRVPVKRWYFNLVIVFFVSGIWHGANWTFIIWGLLHGFYLVFSLITTNIRKKIYNFLLISKNQLFFNLFNVFITFHLVLLSWIFFRANSLSDVIYIFTHLFKNINLNFSGIFLGLGWIELIIAVCSILFLELYHFIEERYNINLLNSNSLIIQWIISFILLFGILLFGVFQSSNFIYFQF